MDTDRDKTESIMKKNDMLGKDGLTVTSANHLANIAKEMYESLESKLQSLKLYSRDYTLAVNGNTYRVENESDKAELETLSESLREVGELKSLIAYLREGIKAKVALGTDSSFEEHVNELVEEGRSDLKRPLERGVVTFAEEFGKLSAEQKARYFALEAKSATLGGFIHPDGALSEARKAFYEHRKNPTKVDGKGQEAEINSFSSEFTAEEVDAVFFALQKEYRTLQAEFNELKSEVERRVAAANKANAAEALAENKLWIEVRKLERARYDEEVKALKVVIPQNLKGIYEKVSAVASAK